MDATLTVRAFFDAPFRLLFLSDARRRTFEEYEITLRKWDAWFADADLAAISVTMLADFRDRLRALGLAPATVNKHLRHVGAILAKAGPPGPHNRDALGVVPTVAWVKPLRCDRRLPRYVSLADVGATYAVADRAIYPRTAKPGQYWRAVIVCALLLAFRRGALLRLPARSIDWANAVVRLPASLDKCHCERMKPATDLVMRHLLPLRDREVPLGWHHGSKAWYWQWHQLQTLANVPAHFGLHDLKRTCGTELARAGASEWQVRYMLDHAQRDVTGRSYVNALEELREVLGRMRVPAEFELQGGERYA